MGAAKGQRGDAVIRQRFEDEADALVTVKQRHLDGLYARVERYEDMARDIKASAASAYEELRRAQSLIDRLRAENKVLKMERQRIIGAVDACKRHISISGNTHKKWAVTFVKNKLIKARLI